ncbi:MAG: hypothetical protein MPJ22_00825 [Pirellulales bacterium]|nr:hypothetical protein [Pirellulales bacterium]
MKGALEWENEYGSNKGAEFYSNAMKILNKKTIRVLSVVDSNTTGLTPDKWAALIYREGTSHKKGVRAAGGSYGIGKNAPYILSDLRTVCYSTRYLGKNGENGRIEKFIGRCKISAHKDLFGNDYMLQNIGWGTKAKIEHGYRTPATEGNSIYEKFRLNESGSGIYIVGFKLNSNNWIKKAKISIACNYFAAIHDEKLKVIIASDSEKFKIDKSTLEQIFENDVKKNTASRHYYHIIRNQNSKKEIIDTKIGTFILQFSIGNEDMPNQICYINRMGMLITDARTLTSNPFHAKINNSYDKYAGVVIAENDDVDKKIRLLEPPNHQAIEYESIEDSKESENMRKIFENIRNKITEIIQKELSNNRKHDETNLDELHDILPFPTDRNVDIEPDGDLDHYEQKHNQSKGTDSSITKPVGGSNGKPKPGSPTSTQHSNDYVPSGSSLSSLNKPRIMRSPTKMRIAFTPTKNGVSIFTIRPAGEENFNEDAIKMKISNVKSNSDHKIKIKNDQIIINSKKDDRVIIDVDVEENDICGGYNLMEVIPDNKKRSKK